MGQLEEAYRLGVERGRAARERKEIDPLWIESRLEWCRQSYPRCADLDLLEMIVQLDQERINSVPDPNKFPETRGLPDCLRREREGFLVGGSCDAKAMIFFYNWFFFVSRRLNTRFAGVSPENLRANK